MNTKHEYWKDVHSTPLSFKIRRPRIPIKDDFQPQKSLFIRIVIVYPHSYLCRKQSRIVNASKKEKCVLYERAGVEDRFQGLFRLCFVCRQMFFSTEQHNLCF